MYVLFSYYRKYASISLRLIFLSNIRVGPPEDCQIFSGELCCLYITSRLVLLIFLQRSFQNTYTVDLLILIKPDFQIEILQHPFVSAEAPGNPKKPSIIGGKTCFHHNLSKTLVAIDK